MTLEYRKCKKPRAKSVGRSGRPPPPSNINTKAHKGTVRAESEGEWKGSAFIVELPVVA